MSGRTKHGMSRTPEYLSWIGMRQRCINKRNSRYKNYGGRGIKICERWNEFENFFFDMGCRPSAQHSIDRINNDGNYDPENCRWATRSQQQRNKSKYTGKEKLARGDDHWTRKDFSRSRKIASQNIKKAHRSGDNNNNAKLVESSVRDIKRRILQGETDTTIASIYGVRPGAIWFIRNGKNWRYVQ